jgi:hypothetical protein
MKTIHIEIRVDFDINVGDKQTCESQEITREMKNVLRNITVLPKGLSDKNGLITGKRIKNLGIYVKDVFVRTPKRIKK